MAGWENHRTNGGFNWKINDNWWIFYNWDITWYHPGIYPMNTYTYIICMYMFFYFKDISLQYPYDIQWIFFEYHKDIIWNIAGISKCNLEIMYIHLHYTTISSNYERDKLIWILIISIYVYIYILVCWFQHISTCSPQYEPIGAIRGP